MPGPSPGFPLAGTVALKPLRPGTVGVNVFAPAFAGVVPPDMGYRMSPLLQDLRFAMRLLRRTPGPTLIAVLALGLGIGLTALMFSIVWGAFLRGLPFEQAHEIVAVRRTDPATGAISIWPSLHDLDDWRNEQRSFEDLAGYFTGTINISDAGSLPERYSGAFITPAAFRLVGEAPVRGQVFTEEDDLPGAPLRVIIGYNVWQERYGGDPDIVGRTLRANGELGEVIGVMPDGFEFPIVQDIWIPLRLNPVEVERGQARTLAVFGRLKDGVSAQQAETELAAISQRFDSLNPNLTRERGVNVLPYTDATIGPDARPMLFTMLGAVSFVLLIACVNVANLLIGRALMRGKEIAVRTAVGATRRRIALQFFAESFALALAGGLLGIGIGHVGMVMFNSSVAGTDPPFWIDIRLDGMVLAWVLATTLLATLAAGVFPALQATRANTHDILKDEARGSSSFRLGRVSRGLVVLEIALSITLLAGAGLMVKGVLLLNRIDLGFPAQEYFTARIGLPDNDYADIDAQRQFYDRLLPRLQALPGARSVAITTGLPGTQGGGTGFTLQGQQYASDLDVPGARWAAVDPGFFTAFDAPVLRGRGFGPEDRETSTPVVIINESFERRWFPQGTAIGSTLRMGGLQSENDWRTIVGVVPDRHAAGAENEDPEALYVPLAQAPARFVSLAVRATGDPMSFTSRVREAVASIDPNLPLYFVDRLDRRVAQENWVFAVFGMLFGVFGLAALFLAGIGLYGVMSFAVSQRTREMGVRMALGAQPADVIRLIFRQGMIQTAAGIVLGIMPALFIANQLSDLIFQVNPRDPAVYFTILAVLLFAAALATWIPSRRATRVDPLDALRAE